MLYTSPDLNGVSKRLQYVQPIRAAATIVLVRSALDEFEIFMVRRTTRAVFGGGMYVIPAATYSLIMFATSLIFVYLVRKTV